jgi:hypothetical protein
VALGPNTYSSALDIRRSAWRRPPRLTGPTMFQIGHYVRVLLDELVQESEWGYSGQISSVWRIAPYVSNLGLDGSGSS